MFRNGIEKARIEDPTNVMRNVALRFIWKGTAPRPTQLLPSKCKGPIVKMLLAIWAYMVRGRIGASGDLGQNAHCEREKFVSITRHHYGLGLNLYLQ